jgi:1-pyrroline-5-carboxylate dehydrogenase
MGQSSTPYAVPNLVDGQWTTKFQKTLDIIHPLDKNALPIFSVYDTQPDEIQPFLESLRKVPKSGMHNPIKNPERYVQYGEISRQVSTLRLILYWT